MAIVSGAGFVARAFSGEQDHLVSIMKEAINYPGYAIVDIFQPCPSFNKINTYKYYNDRVYKLDESYDPSNKMMAIEKTMESDDSLPIGIFYKEDKPNFHDKHEVLSQGKPLLDIKPDKEVINSLIKEFV